MFKSKSKSLFLSSLFKDSSNTFILRLLGNALTFAFVFYIGAQEEGDKLLGKYALFINSLRVFCLLTIFGLGTLTLKHISKYTKKNDLNKISLFISNVYVHVIMLSLLLCFLLLILAPFVEVIYEARMLKYIIFAIIPFSLLTINSELFRGLKQSKLFVLFHELNFIPGCALIFLFLSLFFSPPGQNPNYFILLSIYFLFFLSIYFVLTNNIKFSFNIKQTTFNLLKSSYPLFISSAMFILMQWFDILLLKYYYNDAAVGIYNLCFKIATISTLVLYSVNSIAAPKFSENFHSNKMNELNLNVQNSSRLILLFSMPILIVLFFISPYILNKFGNNFNLGIYAIRILIVGQMVNSFCGSVGYFLLMTGKEKIFNKILLSSLFVNIILNIILIPNYGINGAAIATAISLCIWNIVSVYIIKRKFNILTLYIPKWFKNE